MKIWLACIVSIGLLASCGNKKDGSKVTINGSGSTFQKAFQEVAIEGFTKANGNVTINYSGGGSGKGRQDFADMVTDYGCSDGAFKAEEKAKIKGGEFIYVPVLLGAITVSYNVAGVDKLQLSGETVAKIFQRDIKKWNVGWIGHDATIHAVLGQGRAGRLEAQERLDGRMGLRYTSR
jgi:phosphate transport system substrate-binding protein